MQWKIKIVPSESGTGAAFQPDIPGSKQGDPLQAQVGDAVFWFNEDSTTAHQPYPTTPPGKPGDWGPPVPGQNPSQQLNLDQAGTYDYECALHADEVGQIIVASAVVIGPSGTGAATVAPSALQI